MPGGYGDFEYDFPDGTPIYVAGYAAPVGATTAAAVGYISAQQDIILGGGAISLYQVESDGNVWGASQSAGGSAFGSWQQLSSSGGFVGEPSVVQGSDGLIGLYARTSSGSVMGTAQGSVGGAFGSWIEIGGSVDLTSDPTVLKTQSDEFAMYGVGTDGNVYGTSQTSAAGPWTRGSSCRPLAVSRAPRQRSRVRTA